MGSFTSMPKIIPAAESDDTDISYPLGREDLSSFLDRCSKHLSTLPNPIERTWSRKMIAKIDDAAGKNNCEEAGEKIRVLQWNVLSQALGTKNDNFVRCPASALQWRTRRFRMLEEIARHDADVICLQEVDHFEFLRKSLSALGYEGRFFPKPDSPCLYLQENTGPDGCAIFYKTDRFELTRSESRVIEVWNVESNQVVLLANLRSRLNPELDVCVATTHLKARNGALLSTLRNEQGKDIMQFLRENVGDYLCGSNGGVDETPVILTGDFNAEPTEPVFATVTQEEKMSLSSAYCPHTYTTWKIREDGEHKQTLDYIFHSSNTLKVDATLDMPTGEDIGEARVPSRAYASDHFSLVADLRVVSNKKKKEEE